MPLEVDIRDENQVKEAVTQAVENFGGIDILINNASAISPTGTARKICANKERYNVMVTLL